MRSLLLDTMRLSGGIIRRDEALTAFPLHVVDDALRDGSIVRAHHGVYRLAGLDDLPSRRRAALAYAPDGALSHTDALELWGLPSAASERVHITVGATASAGPSRGLKVHRRLAFEPRPSLVRVRDGFRVVRLEQAILESWKLLPLLDRRAPAIVAVRERRTTPARLLEALDQQRAMPGAREQRRLFGLLAAGNHSELEIWGHERVFSDRRLPLSSTQLEMKIGSRVIYLDRAFDEELVAVELDGAAYHGSPGQREHDLRRDAALARLGWQTVRYSHPRLHNDSGGVIEELVEILARRRAQLRHAG